MATKPTKLLIAASGTGGHLFPAIATAEQLKDYHIEWLGVPNRMETQLIPSRYPLHTIPIEGFQQRFGLGTIRIFSKIISSVFQVRRLLQEQQFQGVFTTGGYIAAPAIIAAKSLGLPAILHESNALPGKVTRWLAPWCSTVAIGFDKTATYLKNAPSMNVGTPVRAEFLRRAPLDLPVPPGVPLIAITGGSQGAVAVNRLVRQCVPAWVAAGAWIFHQTGDNDPEAKEFEHPQYFAVPFYDNMAGVLQRATVAIARAGAGTLTELAITQTPSILIPYPFAAENHQAYNAEVFADAGGAIVHQQAKLTPEILKTTVLDLLADPQRLEQMAQSAASLAIPDSDLRLAKLVRQFLETAPK
ncbi:undecaprenyldiphospho-muramoylpentapeptide beta-N-acetylglucosaminyltransferase [[Phormidium] sp. ETS-05]|uniref:undecaprenyldiphospho-muramoylpentapeptide beta-N-acetylglucosaminyltransferase n=1 Tax=[Phormidium] sp. ETS-05 TaxID=222819 RepID=UPI0018EF2EBF|nr:undecaprenyldiphospho-muramoylpentapeptide beta-N-acetylglucosaminyltransferase [[Phormidium] sp. ETS-05]